MNAVQMRKLYIIIADSPTIEGTYELNGKLNNFFYKLIQIRVWDRKREVGWMDGWKEYMHIMI